MVEPAVESADSGSKSADSNTNPPVGMQASADSP